VTQTETTNGLVSLATARAASHAPSISKTGSLELYYFGPDTDQFAEVFGRIGFIVVPSTRTSNKSENGKAS
jgi:hypothetical protein